MTPADEGIAAAREDARRMAASADARANDAAAYLHAADAKRIAQALYCYAAACQEEGNRANAAWLGAICEAAHAESKRARALAAIFDRAAAEAIEDERRQAGDCNCGALGPLTHRASCPAAPDACPGCGRKPGEWIGAECNDPLGCGYWRTDAAPVRP